MPRKPTAAHSGNVPAVVRDAAMRGEADRYLAATLAPREARSALAALAAFCAEIARVPSTVSETLLGEIRLQWWRDALADGREGRFCGHPVADALIAAASDGGLPSDLLDAIIDARAIDLSGEMFPDDAQLGAYLRATEGNAFLLAMCALGAKPSDVGDLASTAGYAYGVARGLCRLPMLLHNGGMILPANRLKVAGIDPQELTARPASPVLNDAVRGVARAMAGDARDALMRARAQARQLDKAQRTALLPLAMVEPYFRAQSSRKILVEPADVSPARRVVSIGLAHLTGRL